MTTRPGRLKWISCVCALALLAGTPGAAAQEARIPLLAPPIPQLPVGGFLVAPGCGETGTGQSNNTTQKIDDFGTPGSVVTSSLVVTESLPYVWLVLAGVSISHTYPGDLDISLISPAGTPVTLSHRNGGSHDNVFAATDWYDYAITPTTDALYHDNEVQSALIPEEAMGAFEGENGTGTWKLVVADEAISDTGWLNGWELEVFSLTVPPITTTTHFHRSVNMAESDLSAIDSTINVGGVGHSLIDVNLTTDIGHLAPGQLTISLSSPAALTTTISSHSGDSHANWFAGTLWDDDAGDSHPPGPVTMAPFTSSPLTAAVPEGAMGHFIASDPNGTWTLHVADGPPAPGFTLNSWDLDVTTAHCNSTLLPLIRR